MAYKGRVLFRNRDQRGLSALRARMEVNIFLGLQFRTWLEKHFVTAGIAGNLDQVSHFDDLVFSMFLGHGVLHLTTIR